jgi:hypothetical protein
VAAAGAPLIRGSGRSRPTAPRQRFPRGWRPVRRGLIVTGACLRVLRPRSKRTDPDAQRSDAGADRPSVDDARALLARVEMEDATCVDQSGLKYG